jgi:hypothetical protein
MGDAAQDPRAASTTDIKSEPGSAAAVAGHAAQDSRATSAKDVKSEPCAGSAAAAIGHAAQYPRATFRVTENYVPEHESSAAPAAQTVPRATCGVPLTKAGYLFIPGPQRIEQPTNWWAQAGSDSEGEGTPPATSRGEYRPRPYHDTGATLPKPLGDTASGVLGGRVRKTDTGEDRGQELGFKRPPKEATSSAPQKLDAGAKPYKNRGKKDPRSPWKKVKLAARVKDAGPRADRAPATMIHPGADHRFVPELKYEMQDQTAEDWSDQDLWSTKGPSKVPVRAFAAIPIGAYGNGQSTGMSFVPRPYGIRAPAIQISRARRDAGDEYLDQPGATTSVTTRTDPSAEYLLLPSGERVLLGGV